ncbi:MAG: hypothetical protein P8Y38_06990 [Deltaproteobacteria bacterium]|jgi:hypothetical protein
MIETYLQQFREIGLPALVRLSGDEQAVVANWAQKVTDGYAAVLKKFTLKINNAAELPYSKERIKIAIKTLIAAYVFKGMDDSIAILKERYVRLSTFQEIRPQDRKIMVQKDVKTGQTSPNSESSMMAVQQKYMQLVLSEEKILHEDIDTYLNDLNLT